MLPLLSLRATCAPKRSFPQQERLPNEIVDQIYQEAVRLQERSGILIVYRHIGGAESCPKPLYATLTFEELHKAQVDGNAGAATLLLAFKEKLDSLEPGNGNPVDLHFKDSIGLADLLTNDSYPELDVSQNILLRTEKYRGTEMREDEMFHATFAINQQLFERNREALERLLTSGAYPYDDDLLPRDGTTDDWWERFVRSFVEDVERDDSTFAKANKPWNTWDDVTVLSLNSWVTSVFQPAHKILMDKFQSAKPDLPLFLGRVRLYIDSEYQFE